MQLWCGLAIVGWPVDAPVVEDALFGPGAEVAEEAELCLTVCELWEETELARLDLELSRAEVDAIRADAEEAAALLAEEAELERLERQLDAGEAADIDDSWDLGVTPPEHEVLQLADVDALANAEMDLEFKALKVQECELLWLEALDALNALRARTACTSSLTTPPYRSPFPPISPAQTAKTRDQRTPPLLPPPPPRSTPPTTGPRSARIAIGRPVLGVPPVAPDILTTTPVQNLKRCCPTCMPTWLLGRRRLARTRVNV